MANGLGPEKSLGVKERRQALPRENGSEAAALLFTRNGLPDQVLRRPCPPSTVAPGCLWGRA